jgi:hypothetical protein
MTDKSQLEKDIERREFIRKPLSVLVLIALLSIGLGVLGVYTFELKQELLTREQEIISVKNDCDKKKTRLLNRIRELEKAQRELRAGSESITGDFNAVSQDLSL